MVSLLQVRPLKVSWRFGPLELLASMTLRVSHIYREGNVVADILTKSSSPEGFGAHSIPIIEEAFKRVMGLPPAFTVFDDSSSGYPSEGCLVL